MIDDNGKEVVLIPPGQVTIAKLESLTVVTKGKKEPVMRKLGHENDLSNVMLYIPKENYQDIAQSKGALPVCYAFPHYIDNNVANDIEISYSFFNPYNGTVSSNIPGLSTIFATLGVGHHEGDWEHITVRLDNTGSRIMGIHYATHGSTEGKWYFNENRDLKSDKGYKIRADNKQPVTWSTLETHGNHNQPGTIRREPPIKLKALVKTFGVLVERTSDQGRHIDCRANLQVFDPVKPDKDHPWLKFRGRWGGKPPNPKGDIGPDGPAFKDWWLKEEESNKK
jgi:hypothetical protein